MKRSLVVDKATGAGKIDEIRTSYGMFSPRRADVVIEGIERRISLWTHIPADHQEDIQVRSPTGQHAG